MEKKATTIIGYWYVDGWNTNNVIEATNDPSYQNGIKWVTVERCNSRSEAEKVAKLHNEKLEKSK